MHLQTFVHRLAFVAACVLLPAAAHAAPITFNFTVEVTSIGGIATTLFPTLDVGDIITGQYSSDTSIPDSVSNPLQGNYVYDPPATPPFGTFVDVEGQRIAWSGSRIVVVDTAGFDVYIFESGGVASLLQGLSTAKFNGQFNGGGGGLITSTAFPVTPPNPLLFNSANFTLTLGPDSGPDHIRGNVTALAVGPAPSPTPTPPQAPEPATIALVGSGVVAAALRARRRR